ncbi:MAG: hypothetical protein ABIQ95_15265 [Bdellovibrionia bacterium]
MVKYYRAVLVPFILISTGCNAFAPFDSPSGDVQVLAAARACFDQGDFQCAADKYHTLELSTSITTLNQAYSEDAFEILAKNGITFSVFMTSVIDSGGDAGALITKLAGVLRTNGVTNPLVATGYPTRAALFEAYQKSLKMTPGRSRGLITFITATTLMAEILAEDATGIDSVKKVGKLQQSDIVTNPTICVASNGNPPWTGCNAPAAATISDGTAITLSTATASDLAAAPTLHMILAAASEIQSGLSMLTSSGGIGSASGTLATSILGQAIGVPPGTGSAAFRYTLISLGMGTK